MIIKVYKLEEIELGDGRKLKVGIDTIKPQLPTYGKEGDACMDIYPIYCVYDTERDRWVYHTGLVFAIGDTSIVKSVEEEADKNRYKFTISDMPNEMELRPRSNLTKSDFYIPNAPGTLDWGYRGELLMVCKNRTSADLLQAITYLTNGIEKLALRAGCGGEIKQYTSATRRNLSKISKSINTPPYKCDGVDRCCQLLISGSERIEWQEVKALEELGITERGKGGFGSTRGCSNLE